MAQTATSEAVSGQNESQNANQASQQDEVMEEGDADEEEELLDDDEDDDDKGDKDQG